MKVFLSHCKTDRDLARKIATDLNKNGITVCLDEWKVFAGDSLVRKLQGNLNSCDVLGIIFTKNANNSNWVEKEWQSLLYKEINDRKITIIPIKGDDCTLPLVLMDKQFEDFTKDYETASDKLVKKLNYCMKMKHLLNTRDSVIEDNTTNEIEIKFNNLDLQRFCEEDKDKVIKEVSEILGISHAIEITDMRNDNVIRFKFPVKMIIKDIFNRFKQYTNNYVIIEDAWLVRDLKSSLSVSLDEKTLSIKSTGKTPSIYFDTTMGKGFIKGRIVLEHTSEFFNPIVGWMTKNLVSSSINRFDLYCNIEYCNATSFRYLFSFFEYFKKLHTEGVNTKINWYFEEDNLDMLTVGEIYASRNVELHYEFIAIEN
jgi:hypothetical protein